jgi:hypothetical protein
VRPIGRERVTTHKVRGIAGRADSCNEVATLMIKDREGPGDFMPNARRCVARIAHREGRHSLVKPVCASGLE